jgi:putative transposase
MRRTENPTANDQRATPKQHFSRTLAATEHRSDVRTLRRERGIWQRRFWEHAIRYDADYATHMDYVHINPLKHGYVQSVRDWPFSTFYRFVRRGIYPVDWAQDPAIERIVGKRE